MNERRSHSFTLLHTPSHSFTLLDTMRENACRCRSILRVASSTHTHGRRCSEWAREEQSFSFTGTLMSDQRLHDH